jgi:hypothetical protein
MRDFELALLEMLFGALVAQAYFFNFRIEDEAALFFVSRALDRIIKFNPSRQLQFQVAIGSISTIPMFLTRIQRATSRREFITRENASEVIEGLAYDCFYPWCSDIPQ